jgi:hypothetical protein
MRLEKVQSGEEARREIDRLHGKQISFLRGYIGTYVAENGSGQLWISEHSSEREATEVIEKMAHGMKQGKQQQFWHVRKMMIEQRPVYLALGMGQAHYFFQNGAKVIWLAVDPSLAKEGLTAYRLLFMLYNPCISMVWCRDKMLSRGLASRDISRNIPAKWMIGGRNVGRTGKVNVSGYAGDTDANYNCEEKASR